MNKKTLVFIIAFGALTIHLEWRMTKMRKNVVDTLNRVSDNIEGHVQEYMDEVFEGIVEFNKEN